MIVNELCPQGCLVKGEHRHVIQTPAEYGENVSVQPDWCRPLPIQQQSVLLLAARGPDGMRKQHLAKVLIRAYRTMVLNAASLKRTLTWEDRGDTFMDAKIMAPWHVRRGSIAPERVEQWTPSVQWRDAVSNYLLAVDEVPHHYHLHLMHGAQIIGYHHPDAYLRRLWLDFYLKCCEDMHLRPEVCGAMDERLNDFGTSIGGLQ